MLDRVLPDVPAPAAALGIAGLIPFAATAAGPWVGALPAAWAQTALLAYGAVILSFLGGIHWGLAIAGGRAGMRELSLGVLPSLVGWAGLLIGGGTGLLLLVAGFAGVLLADLGLARAGAAPPWFARLRALLTGGVCALLLIAALR
jgi:hypothetical protein